MTSRLVVLLALGVTLWLARGASAQVEAQAGAPPLVLTDPAGSYPAGQSLEILEDPSGRLTIDDVRSPPYGDRFVPQAGEPRQYGLTKTAYWGRLVVRNESSEDLWIVTLPDYFQDYIDFYLFDSSGRRLAATQTGRARPFSTRNLPSPQLVFRADIPPGEEVTVYLRNAGDFSVRFPVALESLAAFTAASSASTLLTSAIYGFLILMAVKNLLIFASLRDRNYLLLVLYIIAAALTMGLRDGRAYQLLWPAAPQFGRLVNVAGIGLQQIFLLLFSISFLEMRRYMPRLRWLAVLLIAAATLATLAVIPAAAGWIDLQPVLAVLIGLGLPTVVLLAIAGPLAWRRGHPAARYFAAAQTVPLLFGIADVLFALGWLAVPAGVVIVPRLGTVLMVLLLSLALTDSVDALRRKAEGAVTAQQETEHLSRQYLNAMPLGVGVFDAHRRLIYANRTAVALASGVDADPNAPYADLARRFPAFRTSTGERYREGEQPLYQGFAGVAGSDDDLTVEVAGRRIPLQTWWTPLRNAHDELVGVISVSADITEKKQAEAELERYHAGLEELVRERTQELMEANAALAGKQRVADTLSEAAVLLAAGPGPGPMLSRILELLGRAVAYRGAAILLENGPDILVVGAAGSATNLLGQRFAADSPDPRARVYRKGRSWFSRVLTWRRTHAHSHSNPNPVVGSACHLRRGAGPSEC